MLQRTGTLVAVGALLLAPVACEDGSTSPEGTAPVTVSLARSDAGSGSVAGDRAALASVDGLDGTAARASLGMVDRIDVTLTGVQVHANATTTGDGNAGWFDLTVESQAEDPVNLMDLSSAGITVARGDLLAGQEINQVRLFIVVDPDADPPEPSITFNQDISFPPSGPQSEVVCEAGVPCPLRIPSAEQTGIKIRVTDFTVGPDANILIEFDAGTSVRNVVINANGAQMTPVLSATGGGG